ncbi:unnamed protein product [Albugo candida]|uniref:PiggyBac transposable element-derived protein domain-containing protein n=1 Tax=Albugo candida TaxID=65357 RepID=A0A024GNG1_9STRA|nr:unnamed protein product [Albugo candida]|eukprot:CCI47881.1 unnamed protein product [Albugo candida]
MQSSHNVHEKFATIECNFPRLVITYSSKAVQISDGVYDLCATRLFLVPYIIYSLLYVFVCSKPQGSVKSPKFFNSCHEQLADTVSKHSYQFDSVVSAYWHTTILMCARQVSKSGKLDRRHKQYSNYSIVIKSFKSIKAGIYKQYCGVRKVPDCPHMFQHIYKPHNKMISMKSLKTNHLPLRSYQGNEKSNTKTHSKASAGMRRTPIISNFTSQLYPHTCQVSNTTAAWNNE